MRVYSRTLPLNGHTIITVCFGCSPDLTFVLAPNIAAIGHVPLAARRGLSGLVRLMLKIVKETRGFLIHHTSSERQYGRTLSNSNDLKLPPRRARIEASAVLDLTS